MLAKNSQAPLSFSKHALSLTIFASKLAPTVGDDRLTDWHCGLPAIAADGNHDAKRAALDLALDLLLILILGAPSNHAGRNSTVIWGVNRQGCRFSRPAPWMARGGGPPNHWRITGTPSLSEVPSGGARAFLVTFGALGTCQCICRLSTVLATHCGLSIRSLRVQINSFCKLPVTCVPAPAAGISRFSGLVQIIAG